MNELVTEERICFWKLSMLNRNSQQTDRKTNWQTKNKETNKPRFPQLVQKFSKWYGAWSSLPKLCEPHYHSIPSHVSLGLQNNYFPCNFFFTITLYVFSFTSMHAMCPTDVSCCDMVILIQYLIQTFKEPKLMPVISTVRKFNTNGGINQTLHRMHHGRIIFVLRFRSSKTWSSVTSQRTGIFNNTTVKISEHALLHLFIG